VEQQLQDVYFIDDRMRIKEPEPAAGSRRRNVEARMPTQQRPHEGEIKRYSLLVA